MTSLSPVRAAFLGCAALARDALARPEVAAGWDGPSALADFSVRGLAGHLSRGVAIVGGFLDGEPPRPGDPIVDSAGYYLAVLDNDDLSSELHRGIRARGDEAAADGAVALVRALGEVIVVLTDRLRREPPDRLIASRGGAAMLLDEYLVTRLVELVVHLDDLAVSVGAPAPVLPDVAITQAALCCWELARRRHGDRAVLLALTRAERDSSRALHVF